MKKTALIFVLFAATNAFAGELFESGKNYRLECTGDGEIWYNPRAVLGESHSAGRFDGTTPFTLLVADDGASFVVLQEDEWVHLTTPIPAGLRPDADGKVSFKTKYKRERFWDPHYGRMFSIPPGIDFFFPRMKTKARIEMTVSESGAAQTIAIESRSGKPFRPMERVSLACAVKEQVSRSVMFRRQFLEGWID